VRALITSVSKIARHVGLTNNAIYRWIKVNRIPGEHIIKVANFYNIELGELMVLTGSELSDSPNVVLKTKDTLPTLLRVQRGEITLQEASNELGQSVIGLKLIMTHWGEQLQHLYNVLTVLEDGKISLDQAAQSLGVAKYTLHGIRRKYGFAPGALKRTRPEKTLPARKAAGKIAALAVIAGSKTAVEAAAEISVSTRTIFRHIDALTSHTLSELAHWPTVFRQALAIEIEKNLPNYAEKWLKKAEDLKLFVRKAAKYPETPKDWKAQPVKRLLVAVLIGEHTLEEIAELKGADPFILESIFTSDLRSLDLTYRELVGLSISHQAAMAELLLWMMDRKRKIA
jgi:hypothetical protein